LVALVALWVVVRRRKNARFAEARRRLYEGAPEAAPEAPAPPAARSLPTAAQIRGKTCPACGSVAPAGNSFCNHCGSPL